MNQQKLVVIPIEPILECANGIVIRSAFFLVPSPKCSRQCGNCLGMIIERNVRLDIEGGGGRHGLRKRKPGRIKRVEPQRPALAESCEHGSIGRSKSRGKVLPERAVLT